MAIPQYALRVPRQRLVKIVCRGSCRGGQTYYAEVCRDNWSKTEDALKTELYATCLRCGYQAHDNYNWLRA
ncbi:hypothetical protein ABIA22_000409 [Sinorhizobium fredii]